MIEGAQLKDAAGNLTVKVGDEIEATVTGNDPENGRLVLRRKAARGQDVAPSCGRRWRPASRSKGWSPPSTRVAPRCRWPACAAFCPLSQLELRYVEDPQQFVGQRLTFRVSRIEAGKTRPNIVLSRRALLEEEAETRAAETREQAEGRRRPHAARSRR